MALDKIVLISNPGSQSRKYSLYKGNDCVLDIHFEIKDDTVVYTVNEQQFSANLSHLSFAATLLPGIITQFMPSISDSDIAVVALRIVAPSSYFQNDHKITPRVIEQLEQLQAAAPLHVGATLSEYRLLAKMFTGVQFVGVSDSAFLAGKPDKAMYYAIPHQDATKLDIKRFGFHGLSLRSVVHQLKQNRTLPERMIVCHLGGGASVAAVKNGKVVDSTMGYSPIEGLVMATRSGSIDMIAAEKITKSLKLSSDERHDYFNSRSGLLGISGTSSDIRQLLKRESTDVRAKQALDMYVYKIQQAIGAMAATMNGADALVFTGTIGYRSGVIRRRVCEKLLFLGFVLDIEKNTHLYTSKNVVRVSTKANPAVVYAVKSDEDATILEQVAILIK